MKKPKQKRITEFAHSYRVEDGDKFQLKDCDPGDTWKFKTDANAGELLARGVKMMSELQERLYAQDRWSLLLIFQAMDAAGKDGTISHVMSGINPQGCQVTSFKSPSSTELNHDFRVPTSPCRSGAGSAFSIAATMRKRSWCAFTTKCSTRKSCPGRS